MIRVTANTDDDNKKKKSERDYDYFCKEKKASLAHPCTTFRYLATSTVELLRQQQREIDE